MVVFPYAVDWCWSSWASVVFCVGVLVAPRFWCLSAVVERPPIRDRDGDAGLSNNLSWAGDRVDRYLSYGR